MEYKEFKPLNASLSKIIFGGGGISGEGRGYGFGKISETKAIDLLLYAYDQGINTFDNAPIYGFGLSEKRMGQAFKNCRDKVHLISKAGVDWHDNGRVNMSNDPKIVESMLEKSLKRLNSDYIDIYYIHWPDSKIDIRYPLEVLFNAQSQAKIKCIGLSNTNKDDLTKAEEVCKVDFIQGECNLFNDTLRDFNAGYMTQGWGTFDKGILAGTVSPERVFDEDDCRRSAPWWKKSNWKERAKLAQDYPDDIFTTALSYSMTREYVDGPIIGFRTIEDIDKVLRTNISIDLANQGIEYFKK